MDEKQLSLLDDHEQADNGPVVCLGMTFKNDEERREYFRNELRKKLPELKKIEGFPIGDDEDIIVLSDPPYYTACPNPWINDFIEEWEREKKEKYGRDENEEYHREPFAVDISEGKNDTVYNAHSYHTKVPYKAIMRYILHYTNPGDLILDGFSGTGMTGVASRRCGSEQDIKSLGFTLNGENILNEDGQIVSKFGQRHVILNDLSPSASLIAYNYNLIPDKKSFINEAKKILRKVKQECSWMYETNHSESSGIQKGIINYVVWSDVFRCPSCTEEIIYWNVAVDTDKKKIINEFECSHCGAKLEKGKLERSWETKYDSHLGKTINIAKQVPVLINYSLGTRRFEKKIDEEDLKLLEKIESVPCNYWYPTDRMPEGDESRRNDRIGFTHVHHFYTSRNLKTLATFVHYSKFSRFFNHLLFFFQASINRATKTNRFRFGGTGGLSGTLYVPSLIFERNVISLLEKKLNDYEKFILEEKGANNVQSVITNQSTTNLSNIKSNSIDYIFTDPPFGKNLMYSELNFLWECWLKIVTNNEKEAIINNTQLKGIYEYQNLMEQSFCNYFRVLKPGRWMTVEFSNSQASVWNAIQEAIQKAGFVIANVSALDKKQGSFKAVTTTTAVKQDLVISAYKPKTEHIEKMRREQNTEESAWTFVRQHLEQLPVFIGHKGEAQIIAERTPRILFDRMVAYHVQNGLPVPISSAEFQAKVAQRFPMRDGMVFLESQVAEYDKKRTLVKEFVQMSLFVTDETSAIEWLRQQLLKKPQTRQDLHPNFMKEIQHIAKHEKLPELDDLLEQNFLKYEGDGPVPDQIASYLRRNYKDLRGLENDDPQLKEKALNRWYVPDPNKQADLEKLREKALLREFEGYVEELSKSKKKLKQFRTEAIRAGFKKAWSEKDYETIVKVGERLPESVIQEDDKLLMYYDNAQIRLGM
ncbi:DNA methyltransferase [Parageobacillus toebii]|uniref:DNA methyltransferase n=1 Tax=Parageobacillus toebii TaxID=153151 RepID=UPI002E1DC4A5|nr:DNA methyltransferase [Parageobacillus toebii]MED4968417.1 DNA methyltransferase [Parageobacillus toebii]